MKKLLTVLIGLLALSGVSSAAVLVVGPTTATTEFFGIPKPVLIPSIELTIGADYKLGDYIVFLLPSGFRFNDPAYFLVANNAGLWSNDPDGNLQPEIVFQAGGFGQNFVQYRVAQATPTVFLNAGAAWRVSNAPAPGAITPPVSILVPAGIGGNNTSFAWYQIGVISFDAILGTSFDPALAVNLLGVRRQYTLGWADPGSVIDVLYERRRFAGDTVNSDATEQINEFLGAIYVAGPMSLPDDYFRHTYSGNFTGTVSGRVYGVTKTFDTTATTQVSNITFGNVVTTVGFNAPATHRIVVDNMTVLEDRDINMKIETVFISGSWFARVLKDSVGWTWRNNAAIFQSAWFSTAILSQNWSTFRFVNMWTKAADVWATIWMDNGDKVTMKLVGNIPARSEKSFTAFAVCEAAGIAYSKVENALHNWKGVIEFVIYAPQGSVFGTELQGLPDGSQQTIQLQKLTWYGAEY